MHRFFWLVLLILCSTCLNCRADDAIPAGELPMTWQTLATDSGGTFEHIRARPDSAWQGIRHGMADFGYTSKTVWMRATLKASQATQHIIELSNPMLDHSTLYIVRANGALEIQSGGFDQFHLNNSLEPYHNQIFELDMARPGEVVTLYLQVAAARPLLVWPRVYVDSVFYRQCVDQRLWLGMYCGVFFALSLLSLMVWITTRDRDYADFLVFTATAGLLQGHLLGIIHEQALYRSPAVMEATSIILPVLAVLAYAHFSRSFLDLKHGYRKADKIMRLCMWLVGAAIPLYLLAGSRLALPAVQIAGAITGIAGMLCALLVLRHGNRASRFYLVANGFLVIGGCIHVASGFHLIEARPWTLYAFPLAAALNMVVIAFSLADKVHLLQRARMLAQEDQLIAEQQIINVLRETEATLESRVAERTNQLEEALRQQNLAREALERTNRTLSELHEERGAFLQIAAHDLKNPTAAIISYADLLRERWHAWDDEKKLRRLGNIRSLAQLSYDIIRNLLDINAIESGHFVLRPHRINPAETLTSVCESFRERANAKDISINLDTPQNPLFVMADKTALHQIFDNLISNAVKYSPQGRRIHVQLEKESRHALIHIRDEGPGISEEDQTRLFRKFTRLSARPTGGEHSTGLGLSIVKHIVEASGGNVGCISRLGEGATFFVSLPLAES